MPHFFISVTQYSLFISLLLPSAESCGTNRPAAIRRYQPLAHLRLYTRCGPAHRLSLQVILFYQVDIILSHPAVNLNVSAALQNTFSDLTNFFLCFWQEPFIFLCTLSVSISLLYCIFSSILRKPNFIPQSGRRNFSKCCTPKTKTRLHARGAHRCAGDSCDPRGAAHSGADRIY